MPEPISQLVLNSQGSEIWQYLGGVFTFSTLHSPNLDSPELITLRSIKQRKSIKLPAQPFGFCVSRWIINKNVGLQRREEHHGLKCPRINIITELFSSLLEETWERRLWVQRTGKIYSPTKQHLQRNSRNGKINSGVPPGRQDPSQP